MSAPQTRTWVSREEIAEIVEARIKRRVEAIAKDRLTVLDEMRVGQDVLRMQSQADTIRANIKLFSNRVGERV